MCANKELFIHPGEWYFGGNHSRLRTLLGSCVALTVWHPRLQLGGMCHYLLPRPPGDDRKTDPRYGINALDLLLRAMAKHAPVTEYQLGCFGGSDMFSGRIKGRVGESNIMLAMQWLAQNRLTLKYQDTGGFASRSVVLELHSGKILLKRADADLQAGGYI